MKTGSNLASQPQEGTAEASGVPRSPHPGPRLPHAAPPRPWAVSLESPPSPQDLANRYVQRGCLANKCCFSMIGIIKIRGVFLQEKNTLKILHRERT